VRRILSFLRSFGFDPVKFVDSFPRIPKYLFQFFRFSVLSRSFDLKVSPYLSDSTSDSGESRGHYFWQDLITAQWVFKNNPNEHLDIGSRVDGFIAHLLCFRKVSVLDLRAQPSKIEGLNFIKGDAQSPLVNLINSFDSVSSLHSIEHFGLGRYGDPIDPSGHEKGLVNIANCVKIGGYFYFSFPIGKTTTYFNEQRVLDPLWAIDVLSNFELVEFVLIPWTEQPIYGSTPKEFDIHKKGFCGLYKMKRIN
jgi:hypothetical protein